MYYSQFSQDKFLNETYFNNKNDGFFIEIGAFDGITASNSKFFENLGWDGICVEPIPSFFEKLKKNRKCKCINAAITNENSEVDFLVCVNNEMLSGILNNYNKKHLNRIDKEKNCNISNEIIKVKTIKFDELCNSDQEIDILFIDTEGSEYDILSSIDFNKYKINFIVFENQYNDHNFKSLLNDKYVFITTLVIDDVYKLKKDMYLL